MIPLSGDFTVLGQVWDVKGNLFKCKFKGLQDPECEGTVLFLQKVKLEGEDPHACDESCKCACHETGIGEEVLRDVADSLNESWSASLDASEGMERSNTRELCWRCISHMYLYSTLAETRFFLPQFVIYIVLLLF